MKSLIIMLLAFMPVAVSCSTTPEIILRKELRQYRPCTEKELKKFRPENDGRISFCFRYCAKYKLLRKHISENCNKWKIDIIDNQSEILQLRSSNFDW
jgi:hypothetical protein